MRRVYKLAILNSHPIQYFVPLYRRLAAEPDLDVTVYFCSRVGLEEAYDPGFGRRVKWDVPLTDGYRHQFLPNWRGGGGVDGFFSLVNPRVVAELWRGGYDAVWVHGHNSATNLMAVAAAKLAGVAVLMRGETHLLLRRAGLKKALRGSAMSLFYRLCDACLAIGTRNAEFYRAHGVGAHKLFTVPYTVDNAFFTEAVARAQTHAGELRRELGVPAGKPLILYASKLMPRKNPHDLLRAFHLLRERGQEAALAVVGSGSELPRLQEYARRHGLSEVYFCGFRNQSELPHYFAAADVFVLPSEDEPWGLIVNEAMCAGLPVVVSEEVGAVPDLVQPGQNGFTFPAGDVAALADRLSALAADPELRRRMGAHSRRLIAEWSYEQCVQGVRAALDYVTRARHGRRPAPAAPASR
jgi:glycosyltransferase involved in cell wall biosynthesis